MASYKQECRRYPYPFWYPLYKSDIFLISSQRTYPERRLMRHESCTRKTSPPTDIFYSFSPAENPPHNFGLTSPLEKYGKIIHFLKLSASGQPHFHISSPEALIFRPSGRLLSEVLFFNYNCRFFPIPPPALS